MHRNDKSMAGGLLVSIAGFPGKSRVTCCCHSGNEGCHPSFLVRYLGPTCGQAWLLSSKQKADQSQNFKCYAICYYAMQCYAILYCTVLYYIKCFVISLSQAHISHKISALFIHHSCHPLEQYFAYAPCCQMMELCLAWVIRIGCGMNAPFNHTASSVSLPILKTCGWL